MGGGDSAVEEATFLTKCTVVANFVRNVASSIAESPPPATINS